VSATVKLIRGANASLSELVPILGTVVVGFGWRIVTANGPQTELVPSAIVCGADGQALSDEHMVFFNQLATPDGAVEYVHGGDEEQIELDLPSVPSEVDRIVFVIYADPDLRRPGTWGSVRSTYVRVLDRSGTEIVRYDVEPGIEPDVTALVLAEIYRHRGSWKVRAVGQGYASGILGVAGDFGVTV
jgi:tellurium resistance protein TerD